MPGLGHKAGHSHITSRQINDYIGHKWNLGTAIPVTINKEVAPENIPDEVYVNGIKLTRGVFDGKLFRNRHITLEGKTNVRNDKIVTGWKS